MQRLNFTLDDSTVEMLDALADKYYGGNKSLTVRAALESLASHIGHAGWVVAGYTPVILDGTASCHSCNTRHDRGDVLFRPVFERGAGATALPKLPADTWLDCRSCVEDRPGAQS